MNQKDINYIKNCFKWDVFIHLAYLILISGIILIDLLFMKIVFFIAITVGFYFEVEQNHSNLKKIKDRK